MNKNGKPLNYLEKEWLWEAPLKGRFRAVFHWHRIPGFQGMCGTRCVCGRHLLSLICWLAAPRTRLGLQLLLLTPDPHSASLSPGPGTQATPRRHCQLLVRVTHMVKVGDNVRRMQVPVCFKPCWVLEVDHLHEKRVAEGTPGLGRTHEWVTRGFGAPYYVSGPCSVSIQT